MYLQWEAARQLEGAAAAARAAGLDLVLYRDLAVGAARDSAEAWGDQALIAQRINVGAPPDQFSRSGQNWGLPPWNPRVLAARAYRPFASLLAANMAGAGALRIDHVMALTRLFWIPGWYAGDAGRVRSPAVRSIDGSRGRGEPAQSLHGDRRRPGLGARRTARASARARASCRIACCSSSATGTADGSFRRTGRISTAGAGDSRDARHADDLPTGGASATSRAALRSD
jgi:hypothetical protein